MMSLLCIHWEKQFFFSLFGIWKCCKNIYQLVPADCVVLFLLSSCKVSSSAQWCQLDWYRTFSLQIYCFSICVALSFSGKKKTWSNFVYSNLCTIWHYQEDSFDQCPMPINTDENIGIDPKYLSIPFIADCMRIVAETISWTTIKVWCSRGNTFGGNTTVVMMRVSVVQYSNDLGSPAYYLAIIAIVVYCWQRYIHIIGTLLYIIFTFYHEFKSSYSLF